MLGWLERCKGYLRVIAMAAFAVLAMSADASGHAVLVDSAPQEGAMLASTPPEIALRFNEPVTLVALRVLDSAGRAVAVGARAPSADSTIRAGLPADLAPGSYLVSWRVVSTDSHPVGGTFVFTVGASDAASVRNDQGRRETAWKAAVIVNRAVGDAALLLAAGGVLAIAVVFGRATPHGSGTILVASSILAMLSGLLSVSLARGWIAAAPAQALLERAIWVLGVDAPHRVRTALIVAGLALALGVLRWPSRTGRLVGAGSALIACAGLPFSGHVAALDPAIPGQLALFLHVVGTAFWIGALPLLALVLRQASAEESLRLLRRFSTVAVAVVVFLVLAGVGVALTRVRDVAALSDGDYGRVLLGKIALVAAMLALAAANRRLTRSPSSAAAARLRRNIVWEIALAAGVVALTAWLGHMRPPQEVQQVPEGRAFVAVERDGAMLLVETVPGRRGLNHLTGRMTDAEGRPVAARELVVELSLAAAGIEALTMPAVLAGDGRFVVDGIALPLAGLWSLRVDALIGDFEKRVFTMQLAIE